MIKVHASNNDQNEKTELWPLEGKQIAILIFLISLRGTFSQAFTLVAILAKGKQVLQKQGTVNLQSV